jgi:hypothetical protein
MEVHIVIELLKGRCFYNVYLLSSSTDDSPLNIEASGDLTNARHTANDFASKIRESGIECLIVERTIKS